LYRSFHALCCFLAVSTELFELLIKVANKSRI